MAPTAFNPLDVPVNIPMRVLAVPTPAQKASSFSPTCAVNSRPIVLYPVMESGLFNHGQGHSVFVGSGRIEILQLHEHGGAFRRNDVLQLHLWCHANRVERRLHKIGRLSIHGCSFLGTNGPGDPAPLASSLELSC